MRNFNDSADLAAMEAGRLLFARPWVLQHAVFKIDQLPDMSVPEVAFAGRSNVGKSSLINALAGQNGLARTSNTPGRTQALYFFGCEAPVRLVDMPGYGYARAAKADIRAWNHLLTRYLRGRANLVRAFLLIDARHGIKPNDREMMRLCDETAVSYQGVLTKIDKPGEAALARTIDETRAYLRQRPAAFPHLLATSVRERVGLNELRAEIARIADR